MTTPSPAPLDSQVTLQRDASADPIGLDPSQLADLLTRLANGQASVAEAMSVLTSKSQAQTAISGATVDVGRQERCGFGEVIYGEGKSSDLIQRIANVQIEAGQNVLVTRIESQSATQLQREFAHSQWNDVARTLRISPQPIQRSASIQQSVSIDPSATDVHHVAVVTAGSTDAPVAEEAIETLTWMGMAYERFDDIGVAGPQRLIAAVPRLQKASAVIVVAGMEGALPSVVSGHLSTPIFAVPTSVGYGATLGGLTPLLGMLSSCAAGVAVVNIDAGFKAGYLAGLVISQIRNALAVQES